MAPATSASATASDPPADPFVLGFLTVRKTAADGHRGGYLLAGATGRPLEFHYTSEVRLDPQQRTLHGDRWRQTLFVESLAVPMTRHQTRRPVAVVVDSHPLLELRRHVPVPVLRVASAAEMEDDGRCRFEAHDAFAADLEILGRFAEEVSERFDWCEPFERLAEALAEIREPTVSLAA